MDDPPAPADPNDVNSLDAIVNALYASVSFEPGEEPQWRRFRSLFDPAALMVRVDARPERLPEEPSLRVSSIDEYIARTTAAIESGALQGFTERELTRRTEVFGDVASVFSSYERSAAQEVRRGINSLSLVKRDERWLVISLCWTDETEQCPLPSRYLPRGP
jgi:hypothetical protein